METYQVEKQEDKKSPDLITHVEVEPAHKHDSHALLPAIDATTERNCRPEELVCDSHYGSDDNVQEAASQKVEVIAPVQGKPYTHNITLADFEINPSTHFVTRCPEGADPLKNYRTRKNKLRAKFAKTICSSCPRLDDCPIVPGSKAFYLHYDDKKLRIAQRRANEQTTAFKDRYRWRAGVEATMSHLKADVGVAQLRVRGLASVRFVVMLKALGLNILRCAKTLCLHFLHRILRLRRLQHSVLNQITFQYDILLSKNC